MSTTENHYQTIKENFDVWLDDKKSHGIISINTCQSYQQTINYFLSYLLAQKILRLNDIETPQLEQFVKVKETKLNKLYASGTQRVRAAAISAFFDWAYQHGYCRHNLSLAYKINTTQKRYYHRDRQKPEVIKPAILTQKEMAKLLNYALEEENFNFVRNKAIVALILSSALYAHELCSLSEKAINFKRHELTVVDRQEKVRIIPLDKALYYAPLKSWLEVRKAYLINQKHPLLFFSSRFNPLNQRTLHTIIAQHFEHIGIVKPQQGSEVLRQTAITLKLAQGVPIEQISAMFELKSLANISRYIQLIE